MTTTHVKLEPTARGSDHQDPTPGYYSNLHCPACHHIHQVRWIDHHPNLVLTQLRTHQYPQIQYQTYPQTYLSYPVHSLCHNHQVALINSPPQAQLFNHHLSDLAPSRKPLPVQPANFQLPTSQTNNPLQPLSLLYPLPVNTYLFLYPIYLYPVHRQPRH